MICTALNAAAEGFNIVDAGHGPTEAAALDVVQLHGDEGPEQTLERVRIATVDGIKATGRYKNQLVREFPDTVRLLPGHHEVVPCLTTKKGVVYGEKLKFYAQEEYTYVINHKFKWDKTLKFWKECSGVDVSTGM